MRWSKAFIPTLRDDPAEADAPSHRLLLRAGFVRQLMAGHYSYLPLGFLVREKIIKIIREEINAIGGQEFLLPIMHPADIWKKTGRFETVDVLFSLKDRKDQDLVLGPTHEEIFTTVFGELQSYKELPQIWYHFQTKFREEARPKGGLMRLREFTMKDSYSFDTDEAGLDKAFDLHFEAYTRIFKRFGIDAVPIDASNGTMGGTASIEFGAPCAAGEDDMVRCSKGDYAANVEKAVSVLPTATDGPGLEAPERFDTPGVRTIADLAAAPYNHGADRQVKTLVYVVGGDITLVLLRGDHELVEQKLMDATGVADIRPAHEDEIKAALGASPGSLGGVGVDKFKILADEALRARRDMVTGANTNDVHVAGVDVERDIKIDQWATLRRVVAGEACPKCGSPLDVVRALEVGHIFKLGRKFTEALDTTVLGPDGTKITPIMGSYGIGVDRAIAAIVEVHHDDKGIVWPQNVAPFDIAVAVLNADDPAAMEVGERLYKELQGQGFDVLLDDRLARPGVKLADIELIGVPWRMTLGKRGLANGLVEVTERSTGVTTEVPLDEAVASVSRQLRS